MPREPKVATPAVPESIGTRTGGDQHPLLYDPQSFNSGHGLKVAATVVLGGLFIGGVVVAGLVHNGSGPTGIALRLLGSVALPVGYVWEAAQLQRLDVYFQAPVPELVPVVALGAVVLLIAAIVAIWRSAYLGAGAILFVLPVPWIGLSFYALQANPYTMGAGTGLYRGSVDWALVSGAAGVIAVMWAFAIASVMAHSRQRRALGGLSPQAARAIRSAEQHGPMVGVAPQPAVAPVGATLGLAASGAAAGATGASTAGRSTVPARTEPIPVVGTDGTVGGDGPTVGSPAAANGDTPTIGSRNAGRPGPNVFWEGGSGDREAVNFEGQSVLNTEWTPPTQLGRVPRVSAPSPATPRPGGVPSAGPLPLNTEYATFWTRLGARLIDFLFVLFVFVPVLVGVTAGIAATTGADPLIAALIAVWLDIGLWELVYYLVGASHGQTIGKRVLGVKVCREDDGGRLGFWKALGRMFASILSSLALYIGWLAPLWTPKHQTWHDSMTHSVVIRDRQARLATPAVVWGLVWTLISGAAFGGLAAWGINAIEDAGYEVDYDSTYEAGSYDDDVLYEDSGFEDSTATTENTYENPTGYDDGSTYDDYSSGSGGVTYMPGEWQKALAEQCRNGEMASCDQLYEDTPSGADIEEVALTCGGVRRRVEPFESCVGWTDLGSDSAFDYEDSYRSSGRLESIAARMASDVRSLTGNWVVQLSSSTTFADNQAGIAPMTESEILDRLNRAESRYSGSSVTPLLLWTGDYNFRYSDMWVVVLDRPYSNYGDVLSFCASEGYSRDHCLAKYLDGSSNWNHTTKLMPG